MPKYNYQFKSPAYTQEEIMDDSGKKLGTIRVKPVSIAWKPANAREYLTVPMDDFIVWNKSKQSGAKATKS